MAMTHDITVPITSHVYSFHRHLYIYIHPYTYSLIHHIFASISFSGRSSSGFFQITILERLYIFFRKSIPGDAEEVIVHPSSFGENDWMPQVFFHALRIQNPS